MTDNYKYAKTIVERLSEAGYLSYFAGGWVRDYVMGHQSEDIDIATSATPLEIMQLFPQTILVGLAFGVVIVIIDGHQFEVATFRQDLHYSDGRRPDQIHLSATPQEDAMRRDFTINGMFFDPLDEVVYDYVHGKEDIKKRIVRAIGNPYERFNEDRLRVLRAFRFAARLQFTIDPETEDAIKANVEKLFPAVAMERVWQELNKIVAYPHVDQAFLEMHRLGVLSEIFPEIKNLHLNDLRHIVQSFHFFTEKPPTILYLMELFQHLTLDQRLEIGKRIKASNKDLKLIEYQESFNQGIHSPNPVHIFAHSDYFLCLSVMAARYHNPHERKAFLQDKEQEFQRLKNHILRIQQRTPLITSSFLMEHGIRPGKYMGLLLKEAESIAIRENSDDQDQVLKKLMKTQIWLEATA